MALQLGDIVPDFKQDSTEGPISFYEYAGSNWVILFSHPKDFTPICTTELGAVAKLKSEFDSRGIKVIGTSVDSLASHEGWVKDIEDTQGVKLNFPLLADENRTVANAYGMIHPNSDDVFTVRTVFVVDPNKKLRLTLTYPAPTGRNFNEILRAVDSLQLTDKFKVGTPVNWKHGEDVIILPSVSDDSAKDLFPDGFKTLKPYLRYTKQPAEKS